LLPSPRDGGKLAVCGRDISAQANSFDATAVAPGTATLDSERDLRETMRMDGVSTKHDAPGAAHRFMALDAMRGIAATAVVFYHIGDFGLIAGLPLFLHGHIFVDFFFVLSGFVIASAYGERLARGFSRATFLLLRLGRIYPLHIFMVGVFAVTKIASGRSLLEGEHGPFFLVRALLLLDAFFTDVANYYNAISWSISAELVAYALSARLFGWGRAGFLTAVAIWLVCAVTFVSDFDVVVFTHLLQEALVGFGFGVGCYGIYRRSTFQAGIYLASLAETAILLVAGALIVWSGDVSPRILVCDLAFIMLILVFARERGVFSRVALTRPMQALGRWSYSIYMVHSFVIMVSSVGLQFLLRRLDYIAWLRQSADRDGLRTVDLGPIGNTLLSLIVVALIIAISSQTYRFIEQPGRQWARRKALRQGKGDAEVAAPTI
jgi:peptidoglycan/LPS O-acetylase OafA/YrhL